VFQLLFEALQRRDMSVLRYIGSDPLLPTPTLSAFVVSSTCSRICSPSAPSTTNRRGSICMPYEATIDLDFSCRLNRQDIIKLGVGDQNI
jgi:hypothetical protein